MRAESTAKPAAPPNAFLSLITPVHNGEQFIEENLRQMVRALEELGRPFEIIVVCDGGVDSSADAARKLNDDRIVVLTYDENQGKGYAITHGMAVAQGRLVGWLDSDLDVDPSVIVEAARVFDREAVDVVVGSKRHPDSAVAYPLLRRIYSWGFQALVRLLFRVNVRDTQVGAKVLRREMVDTVQPLLLIKRYAFDLEVLAVGAEFGFDRIKEVPIDLRYRFSGTGINWRAVRDMFQDTIAIAYRIHLRHWYVRRFASVERQRMDELAHPDVDTKAHDDGAEASEADQPPRPLSPERV